MFRHFAEYLLEFASSSWGPVVMVTHAFFESFILPLAHELFLIPVALMNPKYSLIYALASTAASTCGMSVGYLIGRTGGKKVLTKLVKPELFALAKREIHKYDIWAIAFACFTPVPVKVFALIAGAVHLDFKRFVIVGFFSRGMRYFLVCILLYFYGSRVKVWVLDYMDWLMIGLFGFMIVSYFGGKVITAMLLKKEHLDKPEEIKKETNEELI